MVVVKGREEIGEKRESEDYFIVRELNGGQTRTKQTILLIRKRHRFIAQTFPSSRPQSLVDVWDLPNLDKDEARRRESMPPTNQKKTAELEFLGSWISCTRIKVRI